MSKTTQPRIAICSSASFYAQVIQLSYEVEALGILPVLPRTAERMKQNQDQNLEAITDWSTSSVGYHGKSLLIREHFDEIAACDAVLVANYTKHDKPNYIGPNVLMEMAIAFHLHKPIYILNECPANSPLIDEILGLEPVFLGGDMTGLKCLRS